MEGDAGAGRLNPTEADDSSRTQEMTGDSPESEAPDVPEAAAGGPGTTSADTAAAVDDRVPRGPSRLGRGWALGIVAALLLCAGAVGAGGYVALRFHRDALAIARGDAAALKAAVDCVSATQAPDSGAMAASEQKILDCGTDDFRSQALLYASMLVQAYQAANVHLQVSDVRAAVERNNNDGSVDVLVALRVKVATDQTQNETGYRLRAKMALSDGQYRISKLDPVTK
ncbi:Mce protein [Mycobacterium helveticum]|uniref:Mce protein n=1 Tax=Mycobacterium helveticum TaxID=2592811 RepID=A0A557XNV9_9MYCO|nr:Mce protein [Mycobacterium helveticum]TVS85435.1 Mce protein [Mycobacterium helveticum]TVS87554.1 Mce protein [Mycobacterium helveticum]